jgi:phosphatidylglycerophosphate synthase
MKPRIWTAATLVTLARLAFLPVLWIWALGGRASWVGLGVMASFLGDILDGQLARRMNQVTALGSRLDSLADSLLLVSSVWWLVWFRPELLRAPHVFALAFGLGTWLLLVAVGLLKFRRFLNLHLYTGKASGVVGALFVMDALVFRFHPLLFFVAAFVLSLGNLEGLALMITRSRIDEHIGSILKRTLAPSTHAIAEAL